jgi:putative ABC transport system substrate-binding protein
MALVDGTRVALFTLLILVVTAVSAQSDPADRVYRIGFLAFGPRPVGAVVKSPLVAFRQALRELGYVEGENLIIDERWAEARLNRLPVLAAELVQLNPDIIVASGAGAVRATMRETRKIPIVIAGATDPVAEGLVSSLARPGANVTGVSALPGRELEGKRLQLLQQTIPGVTRVAVILDSTSRLDPAPLEAAARALGITLLFSAETESHEEFRDFFIEMIRDRADAVYAPETPINVRQRGLIVDLALEYRLPAIYGSREYVEAGGLMSYGPSFSELLHRAAIYTHRILQGAIPGELPVEQPMRLELVINNKLAKQLGISFPTTILMQAVEIIE